MKVTHAGRQITVNVRADDDGLASHAGSALLARVADKTGLTRALNVTSASPVCVPAASRVCRRAWGRNEFRRIHSFTRVAYTFTAENFPTGLRSRGFALADGGGHLGGAVGALLLPTLVTGATFFIGFAAIGITGLLAGLIALGGPKTTGLPLEQVRQPRYRRSPRPV